jgi:hypothetical protein
MAPDDAEDSRMQIFELRGLRLVELSLHHSAPFRCLNYNNDSQIDCGLRIQGVYLEHLVRGFCPAFLSLHNNRLPSPLLSLCMSLAHWMLAHL